MLELLHEVINGNSRKPISKYRLYKLLFILYARYLKYGNNIGISRREGICKNKDTAKIDISENTLRKIIKIFVNYGFLEKKGYSTNKTNQVCSVYSIGKEYLDDFLFSVRTFRLKAVNKIDNISDRIIEWCTNMDYREFITSKGFEYNLSLYKNKVIRERNNGHSNTNHIRTNGEIITNFKTDETLNLFDYLKSISGASTSALAHKLGII